MRRVMVLSVSVLLPILAACAHGTTGVGSGGAGVTTVGGTTGAVTAGTGSTGSSGPMTCAGTNGTKGCCVSDTLYFCPSTGMTVKSKDCAAQGLVCGWNAGMKYYGCVAPPASTDPSGNVPAQCGP